MRRCSAFLPALLVALAGCGQGDFFTSHKVTMIALSPPLPGYGLYHAYGDSVTQGYGVADVKEVYASLAAAYNSVPLSDYASSGDEACDIAPKQIFPHGDAPALASNGLYSVLIGTNDIDSRGTGAGEATFNLCDQALLSWLATPQERKLPAGDASVIISGASHVDTAFNFNAITTDAQGASITFPFVRDVAAPVYLWYRISDGNPGSFTCALDGVALPVLAVAPSSPIRTQNLVTTSMAVLRTATVPAGTHTLRCTQNTSGASGMGLIAMGGPPPAGTPHRPRLLAGLPPLQLYGVRGSVLAAYNADIRANVAVFANDGLDIELFDAATYMTGTPADLYDAIHPNATGHYEIFEAFQRVLN